VKRAALQAAFAEQELFEGKSWQLSPQPWELTPEIVEALEGIGQASLEFYKALERLYLRAAEGRKLLRNEELHAPWVADYLDRGKPEALVALSRSKASRGRFPPVIRPDLLATAEGFRLAEFDSVPGGIGLTAYMNRLYAETSPHPILGADGALEKAFYRRLARLAPDKEAPVVAIVVSEESSAYKPEMDWLASRLQSLGHRVHALWTEEVFPLGGSLCFDVEGNPEKIDVLYRFFELFDLPNIGISQAIVEAWTQGEVALDPPLRPFLEEKSALALYHHHLLEPYWKEALPRASRRVLDDLIPKSWILDPAPVPPGAVLVGPPSQGRPLHSWMDLAQASQKERRLALKLSGFHEEAWGSRSVVIGDDVPREEWRAALQRALDMADRNLHVLQEYCKPAQLEHPLYGADGDAPAKPVRGRLRLNPFFVAEGDEASLCGALATFCPPDKKIIHGMQDAALLPCCVRRQ